MSRPAPAHPVATAGVGAIGKRKWIIAAAVLAFAAPAAGMFLLHDREPHLPYDVADGTYAHDCCGKIVLRNGEMTANDVRWVRYVVREDERGPYVLPETFVGTMDRGIERDGSRPAVKLRLDTVPHPNRIEIPSTFGSDAFVRRSTRVRLGGRYSR